MLTRIEGHYALLPSIGRPRVSDRRRRQRDDWASKGWASTVIMKLLRSCCPGG